MLENLEYNKIRGNDDIQARPFLKWVGGKRQLLDEINNRIPKKFDSYIEPFVGGGAVFFNLEPTKATLIDINPELINTYLVIRDDLENLIRELSEHDNTENYFYKIRNLDREESFKKSTPAARAARMIYLNKTCFNGLYRVNSKGEYNTPYGKYKNPKILNEDNLRACSYALQKVRLLEGSFAMTDLYAKKGDFVYFDPPYAPVSPTANFTGYTKEGFATKMQIELRNLCKLLNTKGVYFMLSNSDTPIINELYSEDFKVEIVHANRAINSNGAKRGKVCEVLITNY